MENNMPITQKLIREHRTAGMRKQIFLNSLGQYVPAEMFEYLDENGFFIKPAAIKYHGNYEGGLFDHSFEVMKCLVHMTKKLDIKWQNKRSPYIVGMFHDLCKMDDYIKDEQEWTYNNSPVISGHGEKSVMMLSQFYTLTEEEILCIRYHMGAYKTDDWNGFDKAIRKYQSVLWTHTADMYASKVKNI